MRSRSWLSLGLLAGAGAVLGFALLPQRQALASLRARLHEAETERSRKTMAPPRAAPPKSLTVARPELTSAEKLEQARLRAQVARLRDRQRALASAAEENQRLRAELARSGTNTAARSLPLPPDYVRRSAARMQGFDTPQHTLESFFWAAERRDTNSLFAAMYPEAATELADQLARQGTDAGLWEELARIPGFAVERQEPDGEDKTTLWLEFAPGTDPKPMQFQRIDGQWRVRP
jgi:hypothetical protein